MQRPAARPVPVVLGAVLALLVATTPAFAKEGVSVTLAAPISPDARPGDVVPLVFTAQAISEDGESPLYGTSIFLRLSGPTGATTEAIGVEQSTPGTYQVLIEIPPGGAVGAEFGIHGSGPNGPVDVVWPFDGILVAGTVPPPVDPQAFRLSNGGRYQPVAPVTGSGPALATAPAEVAPPTTTTTAIDLRAPAVLGSLLALAAVGLLHVRRRRGTSPEPI